MFEGAPANVFAIPQTLKSPKSALRRRADFDILSAFCRKVAGWPSDGGTDIVRELTGSVKQRMEADIPFHPLDENNVASKLHVVHLKY